MKSFLRNIMIMSALVLSACSATGQGPNVDDLNTVPQPAVSDING